MPPTGEWTLKRAHRQCLEQIRYQNCVFVLQHGGRSTEDESNAILSPWRMAVLRECLRLFLGDADPPVDGDQKYPITGNDDDMVGGCPLWRGRLRGIIAVQSQPRAAALSAILSRSWPGQMLNIAGHADILNLRMRLEKSPWVASAKDSRLILIVSGICLQMLLTLGLIRVGELDLLLFDDLTRANHGHPYCQVIENFYAPLLAKRLLSVGREPKEERDRFGGRAFPRIGAFASWPRTIPGEALQAKVERLAKLVQYNCKFHSVILPLLLEPVSNAMPVEEFSRRVQVPASFNKIKLIFGNGEDQVSRLAPDYDLILRADKDGLEGLNGDMLETKVGTLDFAKRILLVGKDVASLEASLLVRLVKVADHIACLVPNPSSGALLLARLLGLERAGLDSRSTDERPCEFLSTIEDLAVSAAHLVTSQRSAFHLHCPRTDALITASLSVPLLQAICSYLPKSAIASDQGLGARPSPHLNIHTMPVKRVLATGKVLDGSRSLFLTIIKLPCVLKDWIGELEVRGPLATSRTTSLAYTALEAIKVLHARRVIDDHFSPVMQVCTSLTKRPSLSEDVNSQGEEEREECKEGMSLGEIKEVLPDELRLTSLCQNRNRTLYLYVLHSEILSRVDEEADGENLMNTQLPLDTCIQLMDLNFFVSAGTPSHSCFGLLLGRPLGATHDEQLDGNADSIERTLFETIVPCGTRLEIRVRLRRGVPVTLTEEQWRDLLEFQLFLFGALNPHSIVPGANGPSIAARHEVPLDKRMGYLMTPVIMTGGTKSSLASPTKLDQALYCEFALHGRRRLGDIAGSRGGAPPSLVTPQIDWTTIKASIDQEAYEPLEGLLGEISHLNETQSVPAPRYPTSSGEPPVRVDFSLFTLRRLILYAPHQGIFYRAKRLRPELSTLSPFASKQFPQATNYADYMRIRYELDTQITDADEADGSFPGNKNHPVTGRWGHSTMVQVERIENFANLARWMSSGLYDEYCVGAVPDRQLSEDDNAAETGTMTETEVASTGTAAGTVFCCQFLKIVPLPYGLLRSAMLLLHVLPDLEEQLLTVQFWRDRLPLLRPLWPPFRSMIEALTGVAVNVNYNYERLEILGDSILKLFTTIDAFMGQKVSSPSSNGYLSKLRQERICNYNLFTLGLSLHLPYYARLGKGGGGRSAFFSPPDIWNLLPREITARWPFASVLFDDGLTKWRRIRALNERSGRRHTLHHLFPDGRLVKVTEEQPWPESIPRKFRQLATTSGKDSQEHQSHTSLPEGGAFPVITRYGIPVPAKSLADLMESITAAFYHGPGGLGGALAFLVHTGLVSESTQGWYQERNSRVDTSSSSLVARPECNVGESPSRPPSLGPSSKSAPVLGGASKKHLSSCVFREGPDFDYEQVEGILGYTFRDRRLLLQACTHASVDPLHNSGRLEWLGDALLYWIVTQYYYEEFSDPVWMTPARISWARQTIVCNEAFGALVVSLGLHHFLRVASGTLQLEIDRFACAYQEGQVGESAQANRSTSAQAMVTPAPKVLGDLWEALAGAVFLDLSLQVDATSFVLLPLLLPHIRKHADPHDLINDPTNDFWHYIHVLGITAPVSFHYECRSRTGDSGAATITICKVFLGATLIEEGEGSNRATAKTAALRQAVFHIRTRGWRHLCHLHH